jgi:hypothetical protein
MNKKDIIILTYLFNYCFFYKYGKINCQNKQLIFLVISERENFYALTTYKKTSEEVFKYSVELVLRLLSLLQ